MQINLKQFLSDAYESRHTSSFIRKPARDISIQIDDQDDNDDIQQFCNIFCSVLSGKTFLIELIGNFPVNTEITDLAEIYDGSYSKIHKRLVFKLNTEQIDVLTDLADKIRKTSFSGIEENPGWLTISARTISSLYRFVRIIKEFNNLNQKSFMNKVSAAQSALHSFASFSI